jgi:hypothetical protein
MRGSLLFFGRCAAVREKNQVFPMSLMRRVQGQGVEVIG